METKYVLKIIQKYNVWENGKFFYVKVVHNITLHFMLQQFIHITLHLMLHHFLHITLM